MNAAVPVKQRRTTHGRHCYARSSRQLRGRYPDQPVVSCSASRDALRRGVGYSLWRSETLLLQARIPAEEPGARGTVAEFAGERPIALLAQQMLHASDRVDDVPGIGDDWLSGPAFRTPCVRSAWR